MIISHLKTNLVCAFALISSLCTAQASVENSTSEQENFKIMSNYLSAGGGKWTGINESHDPGNPASAEAYGLWFEKPLDNLLTLKIVVYLKDTIILSSQGVFSWHPKEEKYIHVMSDRANGYSEGVSLFPSDTSFISIMKIYRPDGSSYDHKDDNFIVSKDVHRNISYIKNEQGNWVVKGAYTWTRDPIK